MGVGNSRFKSYTNWLSMLRRCYSNEPNYRNETYADCEVCPEWIYYSNFKKWHDENYVEGWFLDKDLIKEGNKIYSPEFCCYVPRVMNNMLVNQRGKSSTGVYYDKDRELYRASVSMGGKYKYIGRYKTHSEAEEAYIKGKALYVLGIVDKFDKEGKGTKQFKSLLSSIRDRYQHTV